jgi:cysteinyl-tRNA synthetase
VDRFRTAMDDDFDTAHALAVIFEAARDANRLIDDGAPDRAAPIVAAVAELLAVLGLDTREIDLDETGGDDTEIDALVRERDDARAARDFVRSDAIRDELAARGIKLEDTVGGTIWHR